MGIYAAYRLGRQLALQFLFSLEFNEKDWLSALNDFWNMDPLKLSKESFAANEVPAVPQRYGVSINTSAARRFAKLLIKGVCEHREQLDAWITTALVHWKPTRVGRIEWVILRLGLYEMIYLKKSPPVVIIAEAVRLASIFGDVESPKFVNGILNHFLEHDQKTQKNLL